MTIAGFDCEAIYSFEEALTRLIFLSGLPMTTNGWPSGRQEEGCPQIAQNHWQTFLPRGILHFTKTMRGNARNFPF